LAVFANDSSSLVGIFIPAFIFSTPAFDAPEAPFYPMIAAFDGAALVTTFNATRGGRN
jgi:hypothetical protein